MSEHSTTNPTVLEARFARPLVGPSDLVVVDGMPAIEVAFAGRSNAGKSSLMNALMQRRNLVRISGTPGCTRSVNLFVVQVRGSEPIGFADLPGFGFAQRSRQERKSWAELVDAYLMQRPPLKMVILIVDVRRGIEQEEQMLVEMLASRRPPVALCCAATKTDKLPKSKLKAAVTAVKSQFSPKVIPVSAVTHDGIPLLWKEILSVAPSDGTTAPAHQ